MRGGFCRLLEQFVVYFSCCIPVYSNYVHIKYYFLTYLFISVQQWLDRQSCYVLTDRHEIWHDDAWT